MARLAKEKFLVLSVDDSEENRLLLRNALSQRERLHFLGSVSGGEELLGYMKGEGKYADRQKYPLPNSFLLDWELPRKEGLEVVDWLHGQPFDDMVVLVFSGIDRQQVVDQTIKLSPNSLRPPTGHGFRHEKLVKLLEEYLSHK